MLPMFTYTSMTTTAMAPQFLRLFESGRHNCNLFTFTPVFTMVNRNFGP